MTGTMSQLQDLSPIHKGLNVSSPVFPLTERYDRSDQIVGKGKGMIQQVEESPHEITHKHGQ